MREKYIDAAKGFGIILVVWAHACAYGWTIINQFHMPFFFLISGLLYKKDSNISKYILKKTRRLYIPFVVWNLFFILVSTILYSLLGVFDIKQLTFKIIGVLLTLTKDGIFGGATWFLGALFVSSVIYSVLDVWTDRIKHNHLFLLLLCTLLLPFWFKIPI